MVKVELPSGNRCESSSSKSHQDASQQATQSGDKSEDSPGGDGCDPGQCDDPHSLQHGTYGGVLGTCHADGCENASHDGNFEYCYSYCNNSRSQCCHGRGHQHKTSTEYRGSTPDYHHLAWIGIEVR